MRAAASRFGQPSLHTGWLRADAPSPPLPPPSARPLHWCIECAGACGPRDLFCEACARKILARAEKQPCP